MKTLFFYFFISFLFFLQSINLFAQQDTLREGNLIYVQDEYNHVWKAGTKNIGQSHRRFDIYINGHRGQRDTAKSTKELVLSVFTPERIQELDSTIISVMVYFDTIKEKIVQIQFRFAGYEKGDNLPLKLAELEKLESAIIETKHISLKPLGDEIDDRPASVTFPIKFRKIFE